MSTEPIKRRQFLQGTALTLAGAAASKLITPGAAKAEDAPAEKSAPGRRGARKSPHDKVTVGLIGCGDLGRGYHLASAMLPNKRMDVAALCDVDANHRNLAARMCEGKTSHPVGVYEDFRHLLDRKDVQAVVIATPDHWHALIAIAACEAGKDVYCQKPLTWSIEEGKALVAAARKYGTVFQTGSQQRSDDRFRQACELVRNNKIGKIKQVDTVLHTVDSGQWTPVETPPSELNWNFWLGPAPYADYAANRVHYQFRWFYDYSGGVMTDWGAHHNDIAQWGLGTDKTGPISVDGTDAQFHDNGPHTVPGTFKVHYKYASGTELICRTNEFTDADGKFGNGVKFTGENGWVFVSRSEIKASDPELLKIQLGASDVHLIKSGEHHNNWLDCIASRERCICDVEIGHRSVSICHIGNTSMKLGRAIKWNPDKEVFVDDDTANQMLGRPMRGPWHL